jgi:hypothetical protein
MNEFSMCLHALHLLALTSISSSDFYLLACFFAHIERGSKREREREKKEKRIY